MAKIREILIVLVGMRKLLLAVISLLFIQFFTLSTLVMFIVNWTLETGVLTGENLKDVFVLSFQYDAAVVAAYSAANVCSKWIDRWRKSKK